MEHPVWTMFPPIIAHLKASIPCEIPVNKCCNRIMALFVLNMNKKRATTEKMVNRLLFIYDVILTAFRIIFSTWLHNYYYYYYYYCKTHIMYNMRN